MNYPVRITKSWADISGTCQKWAESCEVMVVAQHDSDTKVKQTHCHMYLGSSRHKTPEAYKRQFYAGLPQFKELKGNELWSWTSKVPANKGYIGYMLVRPYKDASGIQMYKMLDPMFYSGITMQEIVEICKGRIQFLIERDLGIMQRPDKEQQDPSRHSELLSAEKKEVKKLRTDWEILDDMIRDLEDLPAKYVLVEVPGLGLINQKRWPRATLQKVVAKVLNANHKKTSVHDAQRWVGTLLRRLDGHADDFWNTVWQRFDPAQ